ncbi:hypothetical protein ACQ4PT_034285 [Festuca glaucescens]
MAEANSYEEQHRRQVKDNKRKLDELGLHNLSAAVRQAAAKAMPTKLVMPRNPVMDVPTRRSGRIANIPEQPSYRTAKAQRDGPVHATKEERAYAITKAEELKDQLGSDHPTFTKPMSHGYATKSDSLKIPMNFRQHLPVHDEMMLLVDEMNNEFHLLYSYKKHRTDGCNHRINQWKGFAAEHELADGDCLVFQLIESRKFKVYIVRASSYHEKDH